MFGIPDHNGFEGNEIAEDFGKDGDVVATHGPQLAPGIADSRIFNTLTVKKIKINDG